MSTLITLAQNTLAADERALATAAQNTTGASNPTYHAETAVESSVTSGIAPLGTDALATPNGMTVSTISRASNPTATQGLLRALGTQASSRATTAALSPLESLFAAGSGGGVHAALSALDQAWGAYQDAPTSAAAQRAVYGAAQETVTAVTNLQDTLSQTAQSLVAQLRSQGQQVGSLVQQIATAQAPLPGMASGSGSRAQIQDQVDGLLQQLAQVGGAEAYPAAHGARLVVAPGGQGPLWVDGASGSASTPSVAVSESSTGPWYTASVSIRTTAGPWSPTMGQMAGTLTALDAVEQWGAQLAGLAQGLASTVPANASTALFSATTGGGLALSAGLTAHQLSSSVAATAQSGLTQALGQWSVLAGAVGTVSQQATTTTATADAAVTAFQTTLQHTTGVDPNQAATAIMQDQQAYQAVAKILSVQQQLVQNLLQSVN